MLMLVIEADQYRYFVIAVKCMLVLMQFPVSLFVFVCAQLLITATLFLHQCLDIRESHQTTPVQGSTVTA